MCVLVSCLRSFLCVCMCAFLCVGVLKQTSSLHIQTTPHRSTTLTRDQAAGGTSGAPATAPKPFRLQAQGRCHCSARHTRAISLSHTHNTQCISSLPFPPPAPLVRTCRQPSSRPEKPAQQRTRAKHHSPLCVRTEPRPQAALRRVCVCVCVCVCARARAFVCSGACMCVRV